MRSAKEHSTASAWQVTVKDSRRYRVEEHELFKGRDGAQIYADVYRVSSLCPEEKLTIESLRHGFKSAALMLKLESKRLDINAFRSKRHDMSMRINAMRSRSRKKKYANNPVPQLQDTVSKDERDLFCSKLKDFTVSLSDLSNTLPRMSKGEALLNLLWEHRVPVIRSTWFIKVVYLNDKSKLNRGARNVRTNVERKSKYREEWTDQLKLYLAKQVSVFVSGSNLYDFCPQDEHVEKWQYLRQLVSWQYEQGLIARVKLLHWLLCQLEQCAASDQLLIGACFWAPIVSQFLPDLHQSRLHLHKLFITAHKLKKKTASDQAVMQQKIQNQINNAAEKFIAFIENAVPLSRGWLAQPAQCNSNNIMMLNIASSPKFNLAQFIICLDRLHECNDSKDRSSLIAICTDSINDNMCVCVPAIQSLLQWAVTVLRSSSMTCIAIALSLLSTIASMQHSLRSSLNTITLNFLCQYKPVCDYEYHQVYRLYGDLSLANFFDHHQYLRRLICLGIFERHDALLAMKSNEEYAHHRYLANIPLHSPSAILIAQRNTSLYGFTSTYNERIRHAFTHCALLHYRAHFGEVFEQTFRHHNEFTSEMFNVVSFTDDDKHRLHIELKCVNFSDHSLTDMQYLVLNTPMFHVQPVLIQIAHVITKLLHKNMPLMCVLRYEDGIISLLSVLHSIQLYHTMCEIIIHILAEMPCFHFIALEAVRCYYSIFACHQVVSTQLQCTLSNVLRHSHTSLQSAEIWLAHARLPSALSTALSDQLVHIFTGRYQEAVSTPPNHVCAPAQLHASIKSLIDMCEEQNTNMSNENTSFLTDSDELFGGGAAKLLQSIAVDNKSIGNIYAIILASSLKCITSKTQTVSFILRTLFRYVYLMREICTASDSLGDNRVPCAALAQSHFVEQLSECGRSQSFASFAVILINGCVLHFHALLVGAIVRPLQSAIEIVRRWHNASGASNNNSSNHETNQPNGVLKSALVAVELVWALLGYHDSAKNNGDKTHFIKALIFQRRRFMVSLAAEKVADVFAVVPLLAELAFSSQNTAKDSANSTSQLLLDLIQRARSTLSGVLTNRVFARFCLSEPDELYRQLASVSSTSVCMRGHACALYERLCQCAFEADQEIVLKSAVGITETVVMQALKNLNPWTLRVDAVRLKLMIFMLRQDNQHVLIEQAIAKLLLSHPSQLNIEIMKRLGGAVGRHILVGVTKSLDDDCHYFNDVVLQHTTLHTNKPPVSLASTSIVVGALGDALPASDCISLTHILATQLHEVASKYDIKHYHHVQMFVLRRVHCLQRLILVIDSKSSLKVIRALHVLLGAEFIYDTCSYDHTEKCVFDQVLILFEALIDRLKFHITLIDSQEFKKDDFIIQLDRELMNMHIPAFIRRRVQRCLPTFNGAIVETSRPSVNSSMMMSSGLTASSIESSSLSTNSSTAAVPAQTSNISHILSPVSGAMSCAKRARYVTRDELRSIDSWTVLQGVPGTPLVQKLLEFSSIISRDGSSVAS